MAAVLVATVGAPNAHRYCTLEEATAYFDERLNVSAWTAAAEDPRIRALITATRRIDEEEFVGVPVSPVTGAEATVTTQALKWPRQAAPDSEGWTYDDSVIPPIVKQATLELALALLAAGTTDLLADSGLEAFENVKIGSLDITPRHERKGAALPEHVRRLLRPVLGGIVGGVRLERA